MEMPVSICKAFSNLNKWRHLPSYQLERRADIFFSIYIQGLMEDYTGLKFKDIIIPEFPLLSDKNNFQTVKVDYALFSEDNRFVYFIELKTDQNSRNTKQDKYLKEARGSNFRNTLEKLLGVVEHSKAKMKYYHLICHLERAGFLMLDENIRQCFNENKTPKELGVLLNKLKDNGITPINSEIRVIYIQPKREENAIGFDDVIVYLKGLDDDFAKLFSLYLNEWKKPAGKESPVFDKATL